MSIGMHGDVSSFQSTELSFQYSSAVAEVEVEHFSLVFAHEGKHDHAMTTYLMCARMFTGCDHGDRYVC